MNRGIITKIIGIVMILASIIVLIWGGVSTRNYVAATAKVTSVEYDPTVIADEDNPSPEDYIVTLEYTVDDTTYTNEIHAHQSDYHTDQEVEIKYDPDHPQHISIGTMNLPIMIGLVAVLIIVGLFIIIKGR